MIFPGHIAAGYLTTRATLAIASFGYLPHHEAGLLLVAGTLLGDGPDVDVIFGFLRKKTLSPTSLTGHRTYLTHAPLIWLILGFCIFLAAPILTAIGGSIAFWKVFGLLVWLCPWSHFICDSLDTGIMWLWPFSKKQFAVYHPQEELDARHVAVPGSWRSLFRGYFKNPLAYIEIAVTLIALCIFIQSL